ncbi:MAG: RING finger domain-containing protein [Candidatus Hodarchaeales archaeon]|jgi:hypothetical protein
MGHVRVDEKEEPKKICVICKQEVEDKNLVLCPFCESIYHQKHIREWLTHKNVCPVCDTTLTGYDIGVPLETRKSIYKQDSHPNVLSNPASQTEEENKFRGYPSEDRRTAFYSLIYTIIGIILFILYADPPQLIFMGCLVLILFLVLFYIFMPRIQKLFNSYLYDDGI